MLIGIALRIITQRRKSLKAKTVFCFNLLYLFTIWAILPLVVLVSISRHTASELFVFANAFFLAFFSLGVCFVTSVAISRFTSDDRKITISVVLNSSFQNCTFLGFPIIYALLGADGLGPATIYAIGISVPHLIFGVILASNVAKKRITAGLVLHNIITFPAAFALIVAILFVTLSAFLPSLIRDTFDVYLADLFFALMLLLVGFRMPIVSPMKYLKTLTTVSIMRFIVGPLVTISAILLLGLNIKTDITPKPALIMAIMPPGMLNLVLALRYKLDLKMYGTLIFYPTLISLFIMLPVLFLLIF